MRFKKIIFLPLLAFTCSIVGCKQHSIFYNLKIKGASHIIGDIKSGQYRSGHKFEFKVGNVTDCSFYPFLNNEMLTSNSHDEDYNAIYEFKMPAKDSELVITSDSFYVDKDYFLPDISHCDLPEVGKIDLVEIETGTIGTAEDNKYVVQSTHRQDIEYNYNLYNNEPFLKADDREATGGGEYMYLKFYVDGRLFHFVRFDNDFAVEESFQGFRYFKYANENPNKPKIDFPAMLVDLA